jgi:hypothetical protein
MQTTADSRPPYMPTAGWQGKFIGFAIAGLVSGTLSVFSGSIPTDRIPSIYIALTPGVIYGAIAALYMRFTGLVLLRTAVLFFVAVVFIWGAAVNFAPAACGDWLHGGGFTCTLAFAGLMGGGVGAAALAVFSAFLIPEFRNPYAIVAMIVIGIGTGGLLTFGELPMFCTWQGGMNLVLGYVLTRRRPPRG